jgi:hypothetical protein
MTRIIVDVDVNAVINFINNSTDKVRQILSEHITEKSIEQNSLDEALHWFRRRNPREAMIHLERALPPSFSGFLEGAFK